MVDLFEVQDGKVVLTEICYTNKTFKEIMKVFKKDKNYMKVFQVLFYMTCPDKKRNAYWDIREDQKEEIILRENAIDFSLDEPVWEDALKLCQIMYGTPTRRLYLAGKVGLDNVADYIQKNKITQENAEDYFGVMNKIGKITDEFKRLEKIYDEEVLSAIRGGGEASYDEV